MEELAKIINTVAQCLEINPSCILNKGTAMAKRGREYVCFIVEDAYPYLITVYESVDGRHKGNIHENAQSMSDSLKKDPDAALRMSDIYHKLGLRNNHEWWNDKAKKRGPSATKRLFGFDYTEEDLQRQRRAMESSAAYMKKLCALGRKPLKEGRVFVDGDPRAIGLNRILNRYR